ncbi:IclR family transcriptional regulator [Clostridium sp. MT-14]|uniref:IclR family transcriptional regulator n=1 Tax=Clostridium aromativorans TaxID=2836848 RepID=A0ABS8N5X9_9CLOT|nr:IclR family transcriptional regulator [Clostridium aromativorans]MCC9295226.1 IclR family transcriptional regulator [Clostridium aromativorans]
MARKNDYNINSLLKSLNVLEDLIEHGEISIIELSSNLGLGKSTVHRILGTFKTMGYVDQNKDNNKYYPTLKIFELGTKVANRIPLKKIIRPYLEEIYRKSHETVNFAILDKDEVVFIDKIVTAEPLRIELEIGKRVPVYCCALGKAILAFSGDVDITKLNFEKITDNTVNSPEKLMEQIKAVKQNGYAIEYEEYIEGLICIAVPIKNQFNQSVAAISIATPTIRMNDERKKQFIKLLQEIVYKIGIIKE